MHMPVLNSNSNAMQPYDTQHHCIKYAPSHLQNSMAPLKGHAQLCVLLDDL